MRSLSGFRPPQFSENDIWLPVWLQKCDFGELNIEGIGKDYMTFEQRVQEFKYLQEGMGNGESTREEGGCNIGQLFISGTDSSPFSFVPSTDNVVQFHLCLSSDGNSDNTALTADVSQTVPSYPLEIQALQSSPVLDQKDANLSFQNSGILDWSPTLVLEKSLKENEFLKCDKSVNFCEDAADAVELCVAASEALVINEAIESDSSAKPSAGAILEASLQVEQARLALLTNTYGCTIDEASEMRNLSDVDDNLSDLDDITMGSAYEDAGIHFNEFLGDKLSISQVNDTFNSEYDENAYHEMIGASAMACGESCDNQDTQVMQGAMDEEVKLRNNLAGESSDADVRSKVIADSECNSGPDVGNHNNCLRTTDDKHLSVSARIIAKTKLQEPEVNSSPRLSDQDGEKYNIIWTVAQERFESRWLGGWTSKVNQAQQYLLTTLKEPFLRKEISDNDKNCDDVTHSIRRPFAGETSFLSESADAAPDENSIAQTLDKGTAIASQLSIPSENLSNRAQGGMLLSQDVERSSSTTLVDPLCSVVPCSISENACSSPAMNFEDTVCPEHLSVTVEHDEGNVLGGGPLNYIAAEVERIDMPVAKIKESGGEVSRPFASLRDHSKLLPRHTNFLKRDSHHKKSFPSYRNTEVTYLETPFTVCEGPAEHVSEVPIFQKVNSPTQSHLVKGGIQHHLHSFDCSMHNLSEENAGKTALPKNKVKFLTSQNLQQPLLCSENYKNLLAPKHVHFLEKETYISNKKQHHRAQTFSKTGCSTRAVKRSTRSSAALDSKAQQMDRFLKCSLIKENKRLIFQNMEFLLTGFSQRKEKEIEGLIRKYGGIVLSHVPPKKGKRNSRFKHLVPIILCLKKTQSLKFLYGCAVNALLLKVNWLIDSIAEGFVLPPKRYMILYKSTNKNDDQVYTALYNTHPLVFNNFGVMFHGKTKYFSNITTIIEHGGGLVFKTLQRLIQSLEAGRVSIGVVVADEENCASRHLKQCALEQNIPVTSVHWILKCLYAGKILPLEEKQSAHCPSAIKLQMCQDPMELSQEI